MADSEARLKGVLPLLKTARDQGASDIHIVAGIPPAFRIDGEIVLADCDPLTQEDTRNLTYQILSEVQKEQLEKEMELSFSIYQSKYGRFRVTIYLHAGNPELAIRPCNEMVQTAEELGLPSVVEDLARKKNGLVIITGPTGTGKTTTMNYMIDLINRERRCKIVTIEDPVEFVHKRKKAIIVQQEVRTDVLSFSRALRHVLRQDPDVICVGEMRDLETIGTALTAAETGHLVIATLHTPNTVQTMERIVGVFPALQQNQVIIQLSNCLQGLLAQLLLPRPGRRGRVLACEVLIATNAARSMIREKGFHKLMSVMQTGRKYKMQTMDSCLLDLYDRGEISYDTALSHARDAETFRKRAKDEPILMD